MTLFFRDFTNRNADENLNVVMLSFSISKKKFNEK